MFIFIFQPLFYLKFILILGIDEKYIEYNIEKKVKEIFVFEKVEKIKLNKRSTLNKKFNKFH